LIRRTITYFVLLTLFLYALRSLHYHGLLKQKEGYYGKYKTAFLEKHDYDVVFLGSSRVEMHFEPRLFDSITGANSFNLSLIGVNSPVAFAALKAYLVNNSAPKHLFYETDFHFLRYNTHDIKEFNNFFPLFKNEVLLEEFNKIDSRMKHFYYNPYYSWPYTGFKNISTSLHGWFNIPNKYDSLMYKGYIKDNFHDPLKFKRVKPYNAYFERGNRDYYDSIIVLCKAKGIEITLISSPMFAGGKVDLLNKNQIVNQLNHIAKINGIQHVDMSSLSFCNQRHLFADHFHLNYKGALLFTRKFANYYRNNLQKNPLKH